jgi:hypothetical protein
VERDRGPALRQEQEDPAHRGHLVNPAHRNCFCLLWGQCYDR